MKIGHVGAGAAPMVEVWRGDILESAHSGHAVVVDEGGEVVAAWGDPGAVILPRSSAKMLQALPLVESGAADDARLTTAQLALACASHTGAPMHTGPVAAWLSALGLGEEDLRCGPEMPRADTDRDALIRAGKPPRPVHNNCSGKHTGFLTLGRRLGGGPEYIDPDHPVQRAVLTAFEEETGAPSPGFGIDGCSAPNFATRLDGLARAMSRFAVADADAGDGRERAAGRLRDAMMAHPELVAGEWRACTRLMRAAPGRLVVKTGAEGVFVAMLPEQRLGLALKIADGATRASECAVAALLVRLGVFAAEDPVVRSLSHAPVENRRGTVVGTLRPDPGLA